MLAQNTTTVNDSIVNDTQEAYLTSYTVVTSAHGRPDVNLRLHKLDRACIVHLPDDLAQLRALGFDPREGDHTAKGIVVAYRQVNGRPTFVSARKAFVSPAGAKGMIKGEERTGKLLAFMPSNWCGTPTLIFKIEGESRQAEAAGADELSKIRALGLDFDHLQQGKWVPAPTGYRVRYVASQVGPALGFVALERESADPVLPSTPTDGNPGAVALLPAWTGDTSERPAAKHRRHLRRLPRQQVGETTYKYTSERMALIPRQPRHELMQALDRLLDHAVAPYLHSGTDLASLREELKRFEDRLVTLKGRVSQSRNAAEAAAKPAANPLTLAIRNQPSVYEQQVTNRVQYEAAELKRLARLWLKLDVVPQGNFASFREGEVTVSLFLAGYTGARTLQITLTSPAIKRQIRGSILFPEHAEQSYAQLWTKYEQAVTELEVRAGRRDGQKERRLKTFPLHQYLH
jgi:hypothetical protein